MPKVGSKHFAYTPKGAAAAMAAAKRTGIPMKIGKAPTKGIKRIKGGNY